jgi:hypothetical protein
MWCYLCQKLNEEALAHATMQYNVQMGSLRTESASTSTAFDKERSTRERLEAEVRLCPAKMFSY